MSIDECEYSVAPSLENTYEQPEQSWDEPIHTYNDPYSNFKSKKQHRKLSFEPPNRASNSSYQLMKTTGTSTNDNLNAEDYYYDQVAKCTLALYPQREKKRPTVTACRRSR